MTERVFLHIGGPKTGTTYLQGVMLGNRKRLAEQGVWYVGDRWIDHVHASLVVREHPRLQRLDKSARLAWQRFVDEAMAFDGPTAVISHETLGVASAQQAAKAIADLAPAEVHLIFSARDFVSQVSATWQEHLKYRFSTPLSQWNPEIGTGPYSEWSFRAIDPVGVLSRWARELPPERVHLLTVPRSGSAPDELWRRFAGIIGIDPDSCDLAVARPNASLGVVEAELLRRVNEHIDKPIRGAQETSRWIRGNLVQLVLSPRGGRRFGVSGEVADHLAEVADEKITQLQLSGYDVVGDLEELRPTPRKEMEQPHPDAVSDSELLTAATEAMAQMLQIIRERTMQRDAARAKMRRRQRSAGTAAPRQAPDDSKPAFLRGRARRLADRLRRRRTTARRSCAGCRRGLGKC